MQYNGASKAPAVTRGPFAALRHFRSPATPFALLGQDDAPASASSMSARVFLFE